MLLFRNHNNITNIPTKNIPIHKLLGNPFQNPNFTKLTFADLNAFLSAPTQRVENHWGFNLYVTNLLLFMMVMAWCYHQQLLRHISIVAYIFTCTDLVTNYKTKIKT